MVNIIKDGDMFAVPADILINPVNRAGISGAGLAKEFKRRFHLHESLWRKVNQFPMKNPLMVMLMDSPISILYFPTKHNPKDQYSDLILIETGLKWLKNRGLVHYLPNSTINMPALGCGLGGLSFEDTIKPLILEMFQDEPYTINLFEPK